MTRSDSDIEQQLSGDDALFEQMAQGVEDDEVVAEEEVAVEEEPIVVDDDLEEEEDLSTNEQDVDEDDESEVEEVLDTGTKPPTKSATKLYTEQEIKELLADGDFKQVDTSRLSEEGKLVMKSMQSGLTPKLQEAASLRQEIAALKESVEKVLPKPQPKDIFEAFDQDPKGVTDFINNQIDELIDRDAPDKEIRVLQETRERLRDYRLSNPAKVTQSQTDVVPKAAMLLQQAIPDLGEKREALRKYAIDVMGYTEAELEQATSINLGESAVREIIRINNAYDKYTAPRRAKAKVKAKVATKVEKSGGGFEKQQTTNIDRISAARKSGESRDWMEVFLNMED